MSYEAKIEKSKLIEYANLGSVLRRWLAALWRLLQ